MATSIPSRLGSLRSRGARVAAGIAAFLATATAGAVEYEVTIDVADDDDLTELFVTNQISEDTFNTLIEMRRRGVDLNNGSREELYTLPNLTYEDVDAILDYREEAGAITDPAALVAAEALPLEKVEQIAPFLIVRVPDRSLSATNGRARFQTAFAPTDGEAPSGALQLRVSTLRYLTVGAAAVVTRQRLHDVRWDPNRQALSARQATHRVHVPKYFAAWDNGDFGIIVGTYRAGFGQRLTFDNSSRFTPNGFYSDDAVFWDPGLSLDCRQSAGELGTSPCAGDRADDRITSDFRWRDGLTGVAAGARMLGDETGWAQVYAFGSYETKSIGQYEIYDRERCEDPRDDDDPECSAPDTFRRGPDPLQPTSRFSFSTLPDLYAETLGGGNVSYFFNRRAHIGVTGYYADVDFLAEGADLDFQEWARTPFGGPYGAIGSDVAWGRDWADVFFEVARSFDNQLDGPVPQTRPDQQSDGGGLAGIVRTTATWQTNEVELVGRYYDDDYANPFARPISAPDEFDGLRARDELGGRVRYTGKIADKLNLRTSADFWTQPSEDQAKLLAFVRGDYQATEQIRPGVWVTYQNKDLASFDRSDCFEISVEFDERGEPIPCGGERLQLTPRLRIQPNKRYYVQLQYEHEWIDDTVSSGEFDDKFRQDIQAFVIAGMNPVDPLRLRARVRYKMEDIENNDRLEQSLWSYLDVAYRFDMGLKVRGRYDVIFYLDDRTSTEDRDPNPEHWGRLELEQKF